MAQNMVSLGKVLCALLKIVFNSLVRWSVLMNEKNQYFSCVGKKSHTEDFTSDTSGHKYVEGFPHQQAVSDTSWFPTIHLNCDTLSLDAPPHTPATLQVQADSHASANWSRSEVPTTPSLSLTSLLEPLTELGETHLPVYYRLWYRIRMDSQMKRHTGWGLGRSSVQKLLSPWSWGVSPPGGAVFASLKSLWISSHWAFEETSSYTHDQSLTPFPDQVLSLENEGIGLKIPFIIMAWAFWWAAPPKEPTQEWPHYNKRCCC